MSEKFNIFSRLLSIAAIAFFFTGCGSDDNDAAVQLRLSAGTVSADETAQFVSVSCQGEWSISVSYPDGGPDWCSVEPASGTGSKSNVRLIFSRNTGESSRSVLITLRSGGRTDTATMTQNGTSGGNGNGGGTDSGWAELPEFEQTDARMFITHHTKLGSRTVRNYSMLYDTEEKISYWVAYPMHPSYRGSSGRTDEWQYDPTVPNSLQANLTRGISGYDRGHQIPSADRTASVAMNEQTFYFTNMTPQNSTLNQKYWSNLEGRVRTWMSGSDTLYVVTGAVLRTVGGNETVRYANDRDGNPIAVPNYYYKVLLGLKNGVYNRAIGFWVENESRTGNPTIAQAKTVREIERLTGFNFFANIPEADQERVETSYSAQDWNLTN